MKNKFSRKSLLLVSMTVVLATVINLFAGVVAFADDATTTDVIEIESAEELEKIGVSVGCITNRRDFPELGSWYGTCEWYINGEEVENSRFVYGVYEGNPEITRNDYNIYFS